jgi:hypothetical protein
MRQHEASRTLVKSPPELWAECSDASSLARHLDQFGEIRITKLEPETAVAWEGERGSGTVKIEPSGWGTKVILTATSVVEEEEAPVVDPAARGDAEPEPAADPEPTAAPEFAGSDPPPAAFGDSDPPDDTSAVLEAPARKRRFRRLWGRLHRPQPVVPQEPAEPEAAEADPLPGVGPEPGPQPAAVAVEVPPTEAALTAALDSLGQAHHRPFSRG